jgi:hypothetical protein
MPLPRPALRLLVPVLVIILLLIPFQAVFAQDESPAEPLNIATILHPPLDEPVAPLDTLILIKIDDYYIGPDHFYLILLDEEPVTARWDPDALTFSYYPGRMLDRGEHTIKVYMTITDGVRNQLVAQGVFTVGTGGPPPQPAGQEQVFDLGTGRVAPPPPVAQPPQYGADFFTLSGRASVNVSFTDIDGLGASLRQEPPNTSIFDLNGRGRSSGTDFDFRFYLTTDEDKYQQPRNRYTFHVEQDTHGFVIGDTLPRLGTLTIDGQRLRGAYGWGAYGPLTVYLAEGQSRRGTPSRDAIDNLPARRGIGEQRLWVARAALWEDLPFSVGFTYLSGEEDPADDPRYGNPGTNTVRSIDFLWQFDGGNGSVRGAWAAADYNYDEPDDTDVSGDEAREIVATYTDSGHTFTAKYQIIDPGFTTLGRLSLQKDKETWGVEDRIFLWRGALTGRLFFEKYHNNIGRSQDYTTTTSRYGGQLRYRLNESGTSLTAGLQIQDRSNDAPVGESGWIDDSVETLNFGIVQSFDFIDGRHDLRVDWRSVDRSSDASELNDSTQDMITVSLTSRWTYGFQLDLLYGNTDSDFTGRDRYTEVNRYSARLAYTHPDRTFNLWTRWEGVRSEGNQATYDSDRDTIEFGMKWMLGTDLSLESSVQFVDFDDHMDNANDFQEHTFRIMIVQLLH